MWEQFVKDPQAVTTARTCSVSCVQGRLWPLPVMLPCSWTRMCLGLRVYGQQLYVPSDPNFTMSYANALTFTKWAILGYRVKKGERAIRSITFVEKKDEEGNVIRRFKRVVCLFYYLQVEKAV